MPVGFAQRMTEFPGLSAASLRIDWPKRLESIAGAELQKSTAGASMGSALELHLLMSILLSAVALSLPLPPLLLLLLLHEPREQDRS